MHSSTLVRAALLAAASLRADFIPTEFNVLAPDSSEARRLYGATTYANPGSRTDVRVLEKGQLRFVADTILSEGTQAYSANVGLILPLRRDWSAMNLTRATDLSFDVRFSAKPTEGLGVSLASSLYGKYSNEGKTHGLLIVPSALPAANVWKSIRIPIDDLKPPSWWTPEADFPAIDSVLKVLSALQFATKTKYSKVGLENGEECSNCVGPTLPEVVMDLRNIRIVWPDEPVLGDGNGCETSNGRLLENFIDGDATNLSKGSWYAFSDTSSQDAKADDSARGTSSVATEITAGDAVSGDLGFVKVTAGLHKTVPGAFAWRPYAGWAAISTDFGEGLNLTARGLTGISFQLRLLRPGARVEGIQFKAHLRGVGDEVAHSALIPSRQVTPGHQDFSTRVCVRPEDLVQPSWFLNKAPFSAVGLHRLTWEVKIADQIDPSITSDSVVFQLSDIRLHGDTGSVAVRRATARASFSATYTSGLLTVNLPAGHQEVAVLSPSGRVVFHRRGEVKALPVSLDRGTWLVVTRDASGSMSSRKLVVLDGR